MDRSTLIWTFKALLKLITNYLVSMLSKFEVSSVGTAPKCLSLNTNDGCTKKSSFIMSQNKIKDKPNGYDLNYCSDVYDLVSVYINDIPSV